MSTHIAGYRPADEKWNAMKAAWDACVLADVPVPDEVMRFFDDEDPGDKSGAKVSIKDAVRPYSTNEVMGWEIDVRKLPDGLAFICIENRW